MSLYLTAFRVSLKERFTLYFSANGELQWQWDPGGRCHTKGYGTSGVTTTSSAGLKLMWTLWIHQVPGHCSHCLGHGEQHQLNRSRGGGKSRPLVVCNQGGVMGRQSAGGDMSSRIQTCGIPWRWDIDAIGFTSYCKSISFYFPHVYV